MTDPPDAVGRSAGGPSAGDAPAGDGPGGDGPAGDSTSIRCAMARLFVAVWPAPAVLTALESVERAPLEQVRWTTPDQWHVTLRFLGSVEVGPALAAVGRIPDGGGVTATLGAAATRLGREVLALPVDGLEALASAVAEAFDGIGRPAERRPFRGHVTLARGRGIGNLPPVRLPSAVAWPVTAAALVRSRLAPTGAHYETIGQRVLGDPVRQAPATPPSGGTSPAW